MFIFFINLTIDRVSCLRVGSWSGESEAPRFSDSGGGRG